MIGEDFSHSPARELQGCLEGIPDDITVAEAVLGSGTAEDHCLLNLLQSDLVTVEVAVSRTALETLIGKAFSLAPGEL